MSPETKEQLQLVADGNVTDATAIGAILAKGILEFNADAERSRGRMLFVTDPYCVRELSCEVDPA